MIDKGHCPQLFATATKTNQVVQVSLIEEYSDMAFPNTKDIVTQQLKHIMGEKSKHSLSMPAYR